MRRGGVRGVRTASQKISRCYYSTANTTSGSVKRDDKEYILSPGTMNPRVQKTSYAVRGELVIRAEKIKRDISDPKQKGKMDFEEIVFCNIGNPQELGQKPITFFRQILALLEYPELAQIAKNAFPADVIKRAQHLLSNIPGGTGKF